MADKIELWLQRYLESQEGRLTPSGRDLGYPTPTDLYRYLNDGLEGAELERMLGFLRGNPEGQELVRRARRLMESESSWEDEKVGEKELARARSLMSPGIPSAPCPHCGGRITPFKRPPGSRRWKTAFWGLLALISFGLSFVVRHYFMQFLAVTLLAGVKAIVDWRATKTQILIYRALSAEPGPEQHRLHQHSSHL